jgi:hypothetical protein
VDAVLVESLNQIQAGFEAAQWKRRLKDQGVVTVEQYQEWYKSQPHHVQAEADRDKKLSAWFLNGRRPDEAEDIRQERTDRLLIATGPCLWAIDVIIENAEAPTDPRLLEHIAWVRSTILPS